MQTKKQGKHLATKNGKHFEVLKTPQSEATTKFLNCYDNNGP